MTSPELSSLAFVLTTHCNLSCSECSVNVPRIARPEHYDLAYIKRAASYFHGIDTVVVTGGEPTGHPQFAEIIPNLKTWFGCRTLSLATNGYRVIEHAGVLTHFDDIYVSHYENNQAEVAFLAANFSDRWPAGPTIHACAARRARHPVPCDLLFARIKYMHGRVYPCCVVPAGTEGRGCRWRGSRWGGS